MREVILQLPDATYERLADAAATVQKPLEQWIIEVLTRNAGKAAYPAASHEMLAAALEVLGFERLAPEKADRLSALLQRRKERSLSGDETAELQTLMTEADTLEFASLERLAATLGR